MTVLLRRTGLLLAATLAAAGAARAQNTLDTTLALRSGGRFQLQNVHGDVTVRSWDRAQARVQAEYDRARITVDEMPGGVSVRTTPRRGDGQVTFNITLPRATLVEITGTSGDVTVDGVCGELTVQSVSGDIQATCVDRASITTVAGDVTLSDARGGVEVNSTAGDVTVDGARGNVAARSVAGDVVLRRVEGRQVSGEAVSGDISYTGRIQENGRYRFESHAGGVTVRLSGNPSAIVDVSTFNGSFESDFPVQLPPGARVTPREWEFQLGGGSARISLRSFSGDVSLRREAGITNREE
jgi:DUF4097 and DUF4098 domain-containing protein YvlB